MSPATSVAGDDHGGRWGQALLPSFDMATEIRTAAFWPIGSKWQRPPAPELDACLLQISAESFPDASRFAMFKNVSIIARS